MYRAHNAFIAILAFSLPIAVGITGPGPQAEDMAEVRIALAAPTAALYANVTLAQELGYYAEEGIEAEITGYRGGGAAQQALVSGEADILGFFPPGVIGAVAKGVEEKVIGGQLNSPVGWAIAVRADSQAVTLSDLDGMTIGVSSIGSTTYHFALAAADATGITVEPVPVGGSYLPALAAGEVDAIVANPSRVAQASSVVDIRIVADLGVLLPNSLPAAWVASDAIIAAHPDAVAGVLRATYRATKYMQEHPDEAIAFIQEFSVIEDDALARAVYETSILPQATSAALDREWLENARSMAILAGLENPPAVEAFYTDRFADVAAE